MLSVEDITNLSIKMDLTVQMMICNIVCCINRMFFEHGSMNPRIQNKLELACGVTTIYKLEDVELLKI